MGYLKYLVNMVKSGGTNPAKAVIYDANDDRHAMAVISESDYKINGNGGCEFLSGANSYTGNFYGIIIKTAPTTLKITPLSGETRYSLNGSSLVATDDLVNYLPTGIYIPIQGSAITITGSGFVIVLKD